MPKSFQIIKLRGHQTQSQGWLWPLMSGTNKQQWTDLYDSIASFWEVLTGLGCQHQQITADYANQYSKHHSCTYTYLTSKELSLVSSTRTLHRIAAPPRPISHLLYRKSLYINTNTRRLWYTVYSKSQHLFSEISAIFHNDTIWKHVLEAARGITVLLIWRRNDCCHSIWPIYTRPEI